MQTIQWVTVVAVVALAPALAHAQVLGTDLAGEGRCTDLSGSDTPICAFVSLQCI